MQEKIGKQSGFAVYKRPGSPDSIACSAPGMRMNPSCGGFWSGDWPTSAAEDLLHEVFIRAMREGRDFCRLDNPRAWLFRVARNAAVDLERRTRPAVPVDENLSAAEPAPPPVDALHQCLLNNLGRLSAPDREIIRRCDLDGQRQADFAEAHGLGLPAAKSRLLRARARLRDLLIENCNVRFDESGSVCCHAQSEDAEPQ